MSNDATTAVETGGIEVIGIAPIPEESRNMSAGMLFVIWALASASATTPVIGLILYKLGVGDFILAVVIAGLIGIIPAGLFSEQGREVPLISLVTARATFGPGAAFILALLYTVAGAGWFGLNTDVGGSILSKLYPGHGSLWYWLLGIGQTILVFLGMKWLEWFYKYTALIFLASYAILIYYMTARHPVVIPHAAGPIHWGSVIETILSFSLLAWAYEFSTVSRFCAPIETTTGFTRRAAYFSAATIGVLLPVLLMGVLGLIAKASTGEWNIALIAVHLPIAGVIAAVGVILAIAHTNAMNLYPAVTKLLAAAQTLREPTRFDQPIAALGLGLLATVLAVLNVLKYVEAFLLLLGSFLFPFTFLMMFDWVVMGRRRMPAAMFFRPARSFGEAFRPAACLAFAFGVILSSGPALGFIPNSWAEAVPWPVISSSLACLVYWALALFSARALGRNVAYEVSGELMKPK
jgi:purine-cytosine permease-like protein